MDRDTFNSTIRAFKHRSPFQPFTIAMVNGDRFEVDHPEALAVRDGMALFAAPGNVPIIFDHEGVSQVVGDLAGHPSACRDGSSRAGSGFSREITIRYAVVIEKGPTNSGAYVPDLPGCIAVAKTAAEVKKLTAEVVPLHLDGLREDGLPIPDPETECEYVDV